PATRGKRLSANLSFSATPSFPKPRVKSNEKEGAVGELSQEVATLLPWSAEKPHYNPSLGRSIVADRRGARSGVQTPRMLPTEPLFYGAASKPRGRSWWVFRAAASRALANWNRCARRPLSRQQKKPYRTEAASCVTPSMEIGSRRRRSKRLALRVPVIVYGRMRDKSVFHEKTRTLSVSAHGGMLALAAPLPVGQAILVVNEATGEEQEARVVYVESDLR